MQAIKNAVKTRTAITKLICDGHDVKTALEIEFVLDKVMQDLYNEGVEAGRVEAFHSKFIEIRYPLHSVIRN